MAWWIILFIPLLLFLWIKIELTYRRIPQNEMEEIFKTFDE